VGHAAINKGQLDEIDIIELIYECDTDGIGIQRGKIYYILCVF